MQLAERNNNNWHGQSRSVTVTADSNIVKGHSVQVSTSRNTHTVKGPEPRRVAACWQQYSAGLWPLTATLNTRTVAADSNIVKGHSVGAPALLATLTL